MLWAKGTSAANWLTTGCKGSDTPQRCTFAPSRKGRMRRVPQRNCTSSTLMSPNLLCQQSFFYPLAKPLRWLAGLPLHGPPCVAPKRPGRHAPYGASPRSGASPRYRRPQLPLLVGDRSQPAFQLLPYLGMGMQSFHQFCVYPVATASARTTSRVGSDPHKLLHTSLNRTRTGPKSCQRLRTCCIY